MHSESAASISKVAVRPSRTSGRRRGLTSMTEKQVQAYLAARDTLRRVRQLHRRARRRPSVGVLEDSTLATAEKSSSCSA